MFDLLLSGFVTLFVIIDPLGLVPLFLALTPEMNEKERQRTALRACLIAFAILTIFALFGLGILRTLGITLGALDQVNDRFGKKTMVLASEGVKRPWQLRADHRSPRYTTRISDLPVVR